MQKEEEQQCKHHAWTQDPDQGWENTEIGLYVLETYGIRFPRPIPRCVLAPKKIKIRARQSRKREESRQTSQPGMGRKRRQEWKVLRCEDMLIAGPG